MQKVVVYDLMGGWEQKPVELPALTSRPWGGRAENVEWINQPRRHKLGKGWIIGIITTLREGRGSSGEQRWSSATRLRSRCGGRGEMPTATTRGNIRVIRGIARSTISERVDLTTHRAGRSDFYEGRLDRCLEEKERGPGVHRLSMESAHYQGWGNWGRNCGGVARLNNDARPERRRTTGQGR